MKEELAELKISTGNILDAEVEKRRSIETELVYLKASIDKALNTEVKMRELAEVELVNIKLKLGQTESHLANIKSKFRESEKVVAEFVSKFADAESRLANTEAKLGNFDLLYEVMSQFPEFKELERDMEYCGLKYAVKWLKCFAQEVNCDQLISMFNRDWELAMKKTSDSTANLDPDNEIGASLPTKIVEFKCKIGIDVEVGINAEVGTTDDMHPTSR